MDHRLKKKKQFAYIYRKGSRKATKFLALFVIPSKFSSYKIGYSVSKKIGKATVRNKVKRRLKEIVRCSTFPKNYFNYVLMAKEGIENLSFLELQSQVKEIFSKIWKSFFWKYFAYLFIFINSSFHRSFPRFAGFIRPVQPTSFKRWENLEFSKGQFME